MTRPAQIEQSRDTQSLAMILGTWRTDRRRVALVPTMGALHDGHLSLINEAARRADRVIVSIFVNPKQFRPDEDLATYPRDEEGDIAACARAGADAVFLPSLELMYPEGYETVVSVPTLGAPLEGEHRPGFFDGVATVVTKLFTLTRPDIAVFGEKDYQQLLVVRRLSEDLHLGVDVVGMPTLREEDGLALSSRNRYLSDSERRLAAHLNQVMGETLARIAGGAPVGRTLSEGVDALHRAGFDSVDYLTLRDAIDLSPLGEEPISVDRLAGTRILSAAKIGKTRLIDNMPGSPS